MEEFERPEINLTWKQVAIAGAAVAGIGAIVLITKWAIGGGKEKRTVEEATVGSDVKEGKVYFTGNPDKLDSVMKRAMDEDKPSLEKMAYDKIAASYSDAESEQERFGVPIELTYNVDGDDPTVEAIIEAQKAEDNGRFEHGPAVDKPEGFEVKVGTYFTTDGVLAGFNDDLFDVNPADYIGVEAASVLDDMKMRSDTAYYVIDRDREVFYEILINRLDTYEEGYSEWVAANSIPRAERF